jgi:hypothetical protein
LQIKSFMALRKYKQSTKPDLRGHVRTQQHIRK